MQYVTLEYKFTMILDNTIKFGEHLIFDAYGCNPEKLNSPDVCRNVLEDLVKIADMTKLSEPALISAVGNETLGGKDPGGISGFVFIAESHISLHTFTKRGFITLDLYSCKPFPTEGVVEYLCDVFETKDINVLKFDRGLRYPSQNIY